MKRAKAKKAKVGRPEGRRPVLALRIDQPIYDKLADAAAAVPGRTVAEETARRITRSFQDEDLLGSPEVRRLTSMVAYTFAAAGEGASHAEHPGGTVTNWQRDPYCYHRAVVAVIESLLNGIPSNDPEDAARIIADAKGRFLTRLANQPSARPISDDQ